MYSVQHNVHTIYTVIFREFHTTPTNFVRFYLINFFEVRLYYKIMGESIMSMSISCIFFIKDKEIILFTDRSYCNI